MQSSSPSRRVAPPPGAPSVAPPVGRNCNSPRHSLTCCWQDEEDPTTGCWTWTATRNAAGYGIVVWATKCYRVHRLLYGTAPAPVADGGR